MKQETRKDGLWERNATQLRIPLKQEYLHADLNKFMKNIRKYMVEKPSIQKNYKTLIQMQLPKEVEYSSWEYSSCMFSTMGSLPGATSKENLLCPETRLQVIHKKGIDLWVTLQRKNHRKITSPLKKKNTRKNMSSYESVNNVLS